MKKKAIVALLAVVMLSMAVPTKADRFDRKNSNNPYRLVGYIAHPIGVGLEYAIMRPIHWVVSQPDLDIVFGHKSHPEDEGTYFEWVHGDYEPSIAEEYEKSGPIEKVDARKEKVKTVQEDED